MDYNSTFKEKLGEMLFLEINKEGFKKSISMPEYVELKNKELYIPVSSKHITSNVNNEIKIKNLPIYYFVEGMFLALGADKDLRFNDDYETLLTYIKDSESCIKSIISKRIEKDELIEAYLLLKGLYRYSKDLDVMKKLLMVGEAIREKDSSFKDIILDDIKYCEDRGLKIPEAYLYKALTLKDGGDFAKAKVAIMEYVKLGGEVREDIKIIIEDINNISDYESAIEDLNDNPTKAIGTLLNLVEKFEENPLIYYYLAVGYRKLENYDQAIYYLRESLEKESGILEVVVELGINYACIQDFETAIKYFKKAFEATREVEICTNIIMCYINLNNIEEAKLHLDIAKKINPDDEIVKEIDAMLNK
ncbi:tetratricopeptide repeat protein [Clostridium sp.]|uniref:tetratricopeptide repeat protein n=1 Tax=Clostridium sp. TaxID=1506 RepID=UPI003F334D88